jgi:hypothetical protein
MNDGAIDVREGEKGRRGDREVAGPDDAPASTGNEAQT